MANKRKETSPQEAVLFLSPERVEWCEPAKDGTTRLGAATPAGTGPADLASAALHAREAAGGTAKRCVLALPESFAKERLVDLPASLGRKDLRAVLERKATSLLLEDADEDAPDPDLLYSARRTRAGDGDQPETWHLVALDGVLLRPLALLLRRKGVHPQRIASLALALPARAHALAGGTDEPVLYVVVHEGGMDVGLVADGETLTRTQMEGDPSRSEGVAAGLVHEVRGIAGFWRRHSRGGSIERVVLFGPELDRARVLAAAIGSVLPGTDVRVFPDPDHGEDPSHAGRPAFLLAAGVVSHLSPDLMFVLPPRRGSIVASLATTAVLAVAGAVQLGGQVETRADDVVRRNQEQARVLRELRAEDERLSGIESGDRQLERVLARVAAIGNHAPPLRPILSEALSALTPAIRLDAIRLTSADGRHRLEIRGAVGGSARERLESLSHLETELRRSPHLASLDLILSDRLPSTRSELHEFRVLADCSTGTR